MGRLVNIWGLAAFLWVVFSHPVWAEDLLLGDLIREALQNNPDIRVAEAQARASEQRISQEGSLSDPVLSAGYQNGGLNGYTFGDSVDSWWAFSLSQTLPFPGKRSLQREAATYEADSARAAAEGMKRDVTNRVTQAYYDLLLAGRELDLIQERMPLAARIEEAALARYASSTGTQEEVIMAQSSKYMLLESQAMASSRKESAEAMLRRETGRTAQGPFARPSLTPPTPFPYTYEQLLQRAEENAPELRQKRDRVFAAEKKLARARKEAWPDITLMPQYFRRGDSFDDMWAFTASIPLPLFYRQKQGAQVSESSWNLSAAKRELEGAKLKVASEIRDSLAMVTASDHVMDLYRNALIPKAKGNINAAIALFSSGKLGAAEALSSLKAPFDYELTLWQQQVQREKAIARIRALTGDMEEAR
jgi:outer membrane protein, heavy metal efflux system